jgi:hypothetical protein
MFGFFNGFVVYGFKDSDDSKILDTNWLSDEFPEITIFADCIIRTVQSGAIYGIQADFDEESGTTSISDEKKEFVKELYDRWLKSTGKKGTKKSSSSSSSKDTPGLEFHLCVGGDLDPCSFQKYKLTEKNEQVITDTHVSSRFDGPPRLVAQSMGMNF